MRYMNIDNTTKMLALFTTYWPTFAPIEGMNRSWADSLSEFTDVEVKAAVKQFLDEENRVFAPSLSELRGRTLVLKSCRKEIDTSILLLESPPKKRAYFQTLEEYSYKTSRTTPKRNKDDADYEIRKAWRVTPQRMKEIEQERFKDGYTKRVTDLGNGKCAVEWIR
jgi:hypothetical protein